MVNTVNTIRNSAGEPVALHVSDGRFVDANVAFYAATIGDLANGATTVSFFLDGGVDEYPFTLATHADDNGVAGATAYAELIRLTRHTKHPHGDPAPVIDDPLDVLRTQIRTLETMLEASVPVVFTFDSVYLRRYTRPDGSRHFGFHFFNNNNAEFEFATGDFTYGLVKVSDDVRHLRVRFHNNNGDVVQELRAPVSTNDFTGFDFKMHGLAKTITGATAYSDFIVADSKAQEAAGSAGGDAGGSGGDAT